MILMSVFKSIKRKCFPSPRGWVMGHCSVSSAGRDTTPFLLIGWISDRNKINERCGDGGDRGFLEIQAYYYHHGHLRLDHLLQPAASCVSVPKVRMLKCLLRGIPGV
jgi:hypothetical protein